MINSLHGKVSLVNNDKVLIIKSVKSQIDFYDDDIHKSYERDGFHYLLDKFDLKDHKVIMLELLNSFQCHLYEYKTHGEQRYSFVFPFDLSNIKDIEVLIPDIFHLKILNNEIIMKKLNQRFKGKYFFINTMQTLLFLKHGEKFNLRQSDGWIKTVDQFAHGYAYIFLC